MSDSVLIALVIAVLVVVGGAILALRRSSSRPEAPRPSLLDAESKPAAAATLPQGEEAEDDAPILSGAPIQTEKQVVSKGLAQTRGGFVTKLAGLFRRGPSLDPAVLTEMEEVLLGADLGVHTATRLVEKLKSGLRSDAKEADAWAALRDEAKAILETGAGAPNLAQKPALILVVGVNGVGKTTTIGKLASRFKANGKSVILAAGDTFRAAAVAQLEVWGRRVGCPVVKGAEKSDPGAVIFDAIQKAKTEGADLVIADTAGRLHTKVPLMEELKKVGRTVEKALGRPADEVWLVLDATNGQNALQQAKLFREAIAVSGIVLTKLDGTAKGGVILGIVDQHRIPVRFIGVGERVEDLRPFDPAAFAEALFEAPSESSQAA